MIINCAIIGFGKSAKRYHLPYLLQRTERYKVKIIYDNVRNPADEQDPLWRDIHFTDNMDNILDDATITLVTLCTPPATHYKYCRLCLEKGKNVIVEKPFTTTVEEAEILFNLAREKGLYITPFQNRRFDSCFMAVQRVIKSGVLGKIVEVESHFDYFRPESPDNPGHYFDGAFYGLGVHQLDQMIHLFGPPQKVSYDLRTLRNKNNPDDAFQVCLHYDDCRVIVKCSHLVMLPAPKFIVHGERGSFIKYGIDQQETHLKAGMMPGQQGFGDDPSPGMVAYLGAQGETVREVISDIKGDYGQVYDRVWNTLLHNAPPYVTEDEIITNLTVLESAFSQPAPFILTLA